MTKRNRNDYAHTTKQLSTTDLAAVTGGLLKDIAASAGAGALAGALAGGSGGYWCEHYIENNWTTDLEPQC